MAIQGWKRFLLEAGRFSGEGKYPIEAYSEFMPPPRVGISPYMCRTAGFFDEEDPLWPSPEHLHQNSSLGARTPS